MNQKFEHLLKEHKLKVTPFRKDVLQLFVEAGRALSQQDLETMLPDADRITLYRTIKNFEDKGLIHKAIDGTSQPKFALCESECNHQKHHDAHVHFHCQKCQHTFCLDHVFVPSVAMPNGFEPLESQMIINGNCKSCNAKITSTN
ncbi:MAG: transcriptional repressor [Lewinellaceae bacterium]|nr:transcriptional repressor [Lewinellaceae bacterium]